jgi:hypothetical protein
VQVKHALVPEGYLEAIRLDWEDDEEGLEVAENVDFLPLSSSLLYVFSFFGVWNSKKKSFFSLFSDFWVSFFLFSSVGIYIYIVLFACRLLHDC